MDKKGPNFDIPSSPSPARKTAGFVMFLIVLLMGNFFLYSKIKRSEVDAYTLQQKLEDKLAKIEKNSSYHLGNAQQEIQQLRSDLDEARTEAAKKAKAEARRYTDRLSKNVASHQRSNQEALMGEIRGVQEMATGTDGKVEAVAGEISSVRQEIAEAKSQIDSADSVLKLTKDELQVMSEWVSSNSSEIGQLREFNERSYLTFRLPKNGKMYKIGGVLMRLRKAEPKRHRFSVELLADDRKMVKKDHYVNEPLQFYVGDSKRPYEIVMTSVRTDEVRGFLATPKIQMARR